MMMQRHTIAHAPAFHPRANLHQRAGCFVTKNARSGHGTILNFFISVGHTPQAATFTNTSCTPQRGTGTVSTRKSFTPRYTTACIVRGMGSVGIKFLLLLIDGLNEIHKFISRLGHKTPVAIAPVKLQCVRV